MPHKRKGTITVNCRIVLKKKAWPIYLMGKTYLTNNDWSDPRGTASYKPHLACYLRAVILPRYVAEQKKCADRRSEPLLSETPGDSTTHTTDEGLCKWSSLSVLKGPCYIYIYIYTYTYNKVINLKLTHHDTRENKQSHHHQRKRRSTREDRERRSPTFALYLLFGSIEKKMCIHKGMYVICNHAK